MWNRAELKQSAKAALKGGYWESVAAFLIAEAIAAGGSLLAVAIPVWGSIASVLFLAMPVTVGLYFFFMQSQVAPPNLRLLFYPFTDGRYMKIVGAMAWMYLFIFLWSLIPSAGLTFAFVKCLAAVLLPLRENWAALGSLTFNAGWLPVLIPSGIILIAGMIVVCIKSLAYSMTPLILTDNPGIGYARALKISIAMTQGHKWNIFVLYLSFIGWWLLAVLTLGIGFVFLAPYLLGTMAQLYVRLRDAAINNGLTTAQELNVIPTK